MTAEDPALLGAEEVIQIAGAFEQNDDAFIIGGQATNLWAWFYQEKEPGLKREGPFTSRDIDYFGSQEVARNVANVLGGKLYLPNPDHHTPNTAKVVTTINGKTVEIDFLGTVLGITDRELRRGVSALSVAGTVDGREAQIIIRVLHPLLCFKSRVINMLHPSMRRTGTIAEKQLHASVIIVRRYIDDALSDGDWKEAKDCLRTLFIIFDQISM
jgi:hypothetical protein